MDSTNDVRNSRKGLRQILFGLLSFLIAFGLLEGVARLVYLIPSVGKSENELPAWVVPSPDFGWTIKPGFHGRVHRVERSFNPQGYVTVDTAQLRHSGRPKVVFIGDSNTFGWAVETPDTFVEVVDSLLPEFDAINLGMNGYSSFQGTRVMTHRAVPLFPAVAVVSFNFNDRRYVLRRGDADGESTFRDRYLIWKVDDVLSNLYLYRVMRSTVRSFTREQKPVDVRLDTLAVRVSPQDYRSNLISMVSTARANNMKVILMLLKDNPGTTKYIRRAMEDPSQADIPNLERGVLGSKVFSDLAKLYLGDVFERAGRLVEAESVRVRRSPFDSYMGGYPLFSDMEYNGIMQRVADSLDVELVDARAVLDEDPGVYSDDWGHFKPEGHRKVAALIARSVNRVLGLPAHFQSDAQSEGAVRQF